MTKPTKWHVRPAKTQISLGIRPVWSESSLSAWRKLGSLATHWAHSEDSDQSGQKPRLIHIFAGCTVILLVLSWGGSFSNRKLVVPLLYKWGESFRVNRCPKLWGKSKKPFSYLDYLGDNCIQNVYLGMYIVGYMVGNFILRRRVSGAVKRNTIYLPKWTFWIWLTPL